MILIKKCAKCGLEKDKSQFNKNKRMKDGIDYYCKECRKPDKQYLKEVYNDRVEFLNTMKTPCVKCGEDRLYVIDFHHVDPSKKEFNLGMSTMRNKSNLLREREKCICLCSNCHKEFHHLYGMKPTNPIEDLEEYLN